MNPKVYAAKLAKSPVHELSKNTRSVPAPVCECGTRPTREDYNKFKAQKFAGSVYRCSACDRLNVIRIRYERDAERRLIPIAAYCEEVVDAFEENANEPGSLFEAYDG